MILETGTVTDSSIDWVKKYNKHVASFMIHLNEESFISPVVVNEAENMIVLSDAYITAIRPDNIVIVGNTGLHGGGFSVSACFSLDTCKCISSSVTPSGQPYDVEMLHRYSRLVQDSVLLRIDNLDLYVKY